VANDPTVAESKPERRPKKRRKVSIEPDVETHVTLETNAGPLATDIVDSQTPLPIFPLPALPNAPSKTELALQGLDQALVDAEIVDAAITLPISPQEDDGLGVSSHTRSRLHELGVTELFAGE
jgi:ATP-dependent RNA helicase DDX51/DBP6